MTYMDEDTGKPINLNYMDYKMGLAMGQHLSPMGQALPATAYANAERVAATAGPVFDKLDANMATFDNAGDRAIYAAFLKTMPREFADEGALTAWLGQLAIGELSPEGQRYMMNAKVAIDTMFSVGRALNIPATELGANMTSMLIPGRFTPNSALGKEQLKIAREYVDSQMGVQVLGGLGKPKAKGPITYYEGADQFQIPPEKEAAFLKAHPNATKSKQQ
jgi:hypothetical protein